ncbi:ATP-binding protein [Thalassoglobus sp.]|uniref:ATP-binding protein n=1 Tax=Thalassoglobus sp. TaxID=2795869 RepID=UPI003AA9320F
MNAREWLRRIGFVASIVCTFRTVAAEEQSTDVLAEFFSSAVRQMSAERMELLDRLEQLSPISTGHEGPRLGSHSSYLDQPDRPVEVVIDLGREVKFDAVTLIPVESMVNNRRVAGYGFPVRFRVETANEISFSKPIMVADHTNRDYPNPGFFPVSLPAEGVTARFLRITSTKHWKRGPGVWVVAMGEIAVFSGNRNVAIGASVRGTWQSHSQPTWMEENLTDGQSGLGLPVTSKQSNTNGYHSKHASEADTIKWVQVDLRQSHAIDEIRLIPSLPHDWPGRPGFGFPVRFQLEISENKDMTDSVVVADYTKADFLNPGNNGVVVHCDGRRARHVRLTATRLFNKGRRGDGSTLCLLALSEFQVYSGNENVALQSEVSSLDSFAGESPPLWAPRYLVDGFSSQNQLIELPRWLNELSQRGVIESRLQAVTLQRSQVVDRIERRVIRLAVFFAIAVGVTMTALLLFVRLRQRRQLDRLRFQIAADLHDDVGSNLGSIRLLSQMALDDNNVSNESNGDLQEINRIAMETADSMRDIVWLIHGDRSTLVELVRRLRTIADSMLSGIDYKFEVRGEPNDLELSLEVRRHLLLSVKEVLHNIVRHADAKRATIEIKVRDKELGITIEDDGVGFDPEATYDGQGLQNLRRRANEMGADLIVQSNPSGGTHMAIRINLQ